MKQKEKTASAKPDMLKYVPIRKYAEEGNCYVKTNSTIIDLVQIKAKDLLNASEDEIEYDILKYLKFYKMYVPDMKLVIMHFPCSTTEQQQYIQHKINTTKNFKFKARLELELRRLKEVEKTVTSKEFYIMLFSKDIAENYKNIGLALSTLSTGKQRMIERIPTDKKNKILFKLNNMCTTL